MHTRPARAVSGGPCGRLQTAAGRGGHVSGLVSADAIRLDKHTRRSPPEIYRKCKFQAFVLFINGEQCKSEARMEDALESQRMHCSTPIRLVCECFPLAQPCEARPFAILGQIVRVPGKFGVMMLLIRPSVPSVCTEVKIVK